MLVEFNEDTQVEPYQSAQFGEEQDGKIISMFESETYKKDKLGLK
jgi:hypothetical protein